MTKFLIIYLLIPLNLAFSQFVENENKEKFFFDAVVFDTDNLDSAKIDLFFMVPYQTLNFKSNQNIFGADYQIVASAYDSTGYKILTETLSKTIATKDYFASLGGNGEFDKATIRIKLPAGEYQIKTELVDSFDNTSYLKSRNISVLNFANYDFSLSGILLISTIEEVNGKYKITPYLSDDIGAVKDGFFVFFEAYNYKLIHDSLYFNYDIFSGDNIIYTSELQKKYVGNDISRIYMKIDLPKKLLPGSLKLRINAYKANEISESNILAAAQRSIKYERSAGAKLYANIKESVDKLAYIAYNDELAEIKNCETEDEMILKFDAFWESRDPSPGTPRNEALLEYYSRIEFAEKNFRSYTSGWRTDKGMVYIVFGAPMNLTRSTNYNDGRLYEQWTYSNNREFLFVDNTGFGDFRLVRPITVNEKYEYGRN